ncbi:MAG: acyl-CoA reductase [Saprospiraceae bacterium]|nr:acyl-CoA reductase [Saprospiraceae bacterium]
MDIKHRINAFVELGRLLKQISVDDFSGEFSENLKSFSNIIKTTHHLNPWFTEENVRNSICSLAEMLKKESIDKWISKYLEKLEHVKADNRVAVILAGNIPLVGFHDFLCVLISGNTFIGKLSAKDDKLLPAVADLLIKINPEFKDKIEFTDELLKSFDAVIATGSDNSSRYFDYYFGKYPNIIRRNRNSVAVLNGSESKEDIEKLGFDIFSYFGLGCRNVSKLYLPEGYDVDLFYKGIFKFKDVANHAKYASNYSYYKSIYLLAQTVHYDNGFCILKQDTDLSAAVSVVNFEYYKNIADVNNNLQINSDKIQCIVSIDENIKNAIPFGNTQSPDLWDYADGVNTMEFLLDLKSL